MNISEERRREIDKEVAKHLIAFDEDSTYVANGFAQGAEWADEHPSKDLVERILQVEHDLEFNNIDFNLSDEAIKAIIERL